MTTARTIALASALIAALAAPPARAQEMPDFVEFAPPQGPRVRAVMSGADFDAAMEAVGFDEGQRTTAGSMFDDAQARMFEAKRAADAQARGVGLFDRSARAVEERSKAARELRTRMLATVDDLFAALGAVATAEQQPALARERAKARRNVIRATMPPAGLGVRVASTDVEASLSRAGIDPAVATGASRATAPLDERLESALVRAADARDAYDRAAARAREGKGDREAERKAMREATAAVGQLHRDALAAAAAALPPAGARTVCSTAARRIWPATSDARSPERVIGQLLGDDLPTERRAAVEAVAATWWAAWWPATLKVAEASEQGGPFPNKQALDEPRRAADRAAWQALAEIDGANRDFHLANAESNTDAKRGFPVETRGGPSLPGREGSGVAGGEAVEAVGMMIASAVTVTATTAEPGDAIPAPPEGAEGNVMTFTLDASDLDLAGGTVVLGDASIEMADGALDAIPIEPLGEEERLALIRAYELALVRLGPPTPEAAARIAARFLPLFPADSFDLDRALASLLVAVRAPGIATLLTERLAAPSPSAGGTNLAPSEEDLQRLIGRNANYGSAVRASLENRSDLLQVHYAYALRTLNDLPGSPAWTPAARRAYYEWFARARQWAGGNSFQKFLTNIESESLAGLSENEKLALEALGLRKPWVPPPLPKPQGPGRKWTVEEVLAIAEPGLAPGKRNFEKGKRAFAAARCVVCHRFEADGGATGPDLTQAGGRFQVKDLVEAIVEPSRVVSDQYKATVVTTQDGRTVVGRIVAEDPEALTVVTDPEDATKVVRLARADVEELVPSPTSLMPAGLLDALGEEEVLDLLAYTLSRGRKNDPRFRRR